MSSTTSDSAASYLVTLSRDGEDVEFYDNTPETAPPAAKRRRSFALDSLSQSPIYAGIAAVLIGFALIAVAWGQVAGEANVALQMPYVVSAGFTGLGLIMCGLLVVNITAKRQDAAERARQFAQLTDLLRELRGTLDADEETRR